MRPKEHLPTTKSDLMLETCSKVRQPLSHLQREQDLIIENPPYRETLGQFPLDVHLPGMKVFGRVNP
jgi:hypothetical protein